MAAELDVSAASVSRHWCAHGLKPQAVREFKVSRDPKFAQKLEDIVGLYMSPPEHSLVLQMRRARCRRSDSATARPPVGGPARQCRCVASAIRSGKSLTKPGEANRGLLSLKCLVTDAKLHE